jgi:hypothetical protein
VKTKKSGGNTLIRQKLMEIAKAKKIVYFRIMNKAELVEVLKSGTTTKRIAEIQKIAIKRWKSGWKFNKKKSR